MPDIDGNGIDDTYEQVFNALKTYWQGLISGSEVDFQFSCNNPFGPEIGDISWSFEPYDAIDEVNWNSSNPVNTVFKIPTSVDVASLNFVSDDG